MEPLYKHRQRLVYAILLSSSYPQLILEKPLHFHIFFLLSNLAKCHSYNNFSKGILDNWIFVLTQNEGIGTCSHNYNIHIWKTVCKAWFWNCYLGEFFFLVLLYHEQKNTNLNWKYEKKKELFFILHWWNICNCLWVPNFCTFQSLV